ncbi:hypothetical protein BYT27DRAFT_7196385 [Phlegmacium glaucopus]|nr:hypothetical protein BYT27DRAFT_7196385 [Phlegmacium glaucopus]
MVILETYASNGLLSRRITHGRSLYCICVDPDPKDARRHPSRHGSGLHIDSIAGHAANVQIYYFDIDTSVTVAAAMKHGLTFHVLLSALQVRGTELTNTASEAIMMAGRTTGGIGVVNCANLSVPLFF